MNEFILESEMVEKISTRLSRHIVPLFISGVGRIPQLCGSGFLVSVGSTSFLISAAHVFDELKKGRDLFFYMEPKTLRKLSASGQILVTKIPDGKTREQDDLDVGVFKFEGSGQPPYPAVEKEALSVDALLPGALPREGKTYLIVGFPASKTRFNPINPALKSKVYSFRNISHPTDKYGEIGLEPQNHIAVIFERKRSVGPDGKPRWFPKPHGVSGSPVWLLYSEQEDPDNPKPISAVGVTIEHRKDQRAIVATDIGVALDMIQRLYNEEISKPLPS